MPARISCGILLGFLHLQIASIGIRLRLSQSKPLTPPVIAKKHLAEPTIGWCPMSILKDHWGLIGNTRSIATAIPALQEGLEAAQIMVPCLRWKRLEKQSAERSIGVILRLVNLVVAVDVPMFLDVETP